MESQSTSCGTTGISHSVPCRTFVGEVNSLPLIASAAMKVSATHEFLCEVLPFYEKLTSVGLSSVTILARQAKFLSPVNYTVKTVDDWGVQAVDKFKKTFPFICATSEQSIYLERSREAVQEWREWGASEDDTDGKLDKKRKEPEDSSSDDECCVSCELLHILSSYKAEDDPDYVPSNESTTDSLEYKSDTDVDDKGIAKKEGEENYQNCRVEEESVPNHRGGGEGNKQHQNEAEMDCGGKSQDSQGTCREVAEETSPNKVP
ncbi:hypothetical protein Pmani_012729 [Petrolisthes manimaculis]|uniref:Uncharacterized protein n=1 Tax=Petrolisthes manimaculis TaxID=1843537 RepID=A0AAE1UEC2_9EUCA|nr:hypothetical protein Pmani_012729 [Petrolisthes manimaculis]